MVLKVRIMLKLLLLALLFGFSVSAARVGLMQASDQPFASYHVYFSESNEEASPFDRSSSGASRFAGFLEQLGAEVHVLDWRKDIPADANLVVMLGLQRDLSADQVARLWHYLVNGGRLLLALDPLEVSIDQGTQIIDATRALGSTRGLFQLLWSDFGIRGRDDLLMLDAEARAASGATDAELDLEQTLSLVTDFTTTTLNRDVPINAGVTSSLAFFSARSVEFDSTIQPYETVPLVFASEGYYGESTYARFLADGIAEYDEVVDTAPESLAVAVAFTNPSSSARIILLGDREFTTNGGGFQSSPPTSANFTYPSNIQFLINAVAWLMDGETPVTIPIISSSPAAFAPAVRVDESLEKQHNGSVKGITRDR